MLESRRGDLGSQRAFSEGWHAASGVGNSAVDVSDSGSRARTLGHRIDAETRIVIEVVERRVMKIMRKRSSWSRYGCCSIYTCCRTGEGAMQSKR
jgi:hypothetical protein